MENESLDLRKYGNTEKIFVKWKYGENIRKTELWSFITLVPGRAQMTSIEGG